MPLKGCLHTGADRGCLVARRLAFLVSCGNRNDKICLGYHKCRRVVACNCVSCLTHKTPGHVQSPCHSPTSGEAVLCCRLCKERWAWQGTQRLAFDPGVRESSKPGQVGLDKTIVRMKVATPVPLQRVCVCVLCPTHRCLQGKETAALKAYQSGNSCYLGLSPYANVWGLTAGSPSQGETRKPAKRQYCGRAEAKMASC